MTIKIKKVIPRHNIPNKEASKINAEISNLKKSIKTKKEELNKDTVFQCNISFHEFEQITGIRHLNVHSLYELCSTNGFDMKSIFFSSGMLISRCSKLNRALNQMKFDYLNERANIEIDKLNSKLIAIQNSNESLMNWTAYCGKLLQSYIEANNINAFVGLINKPGELNIIFKEQPTDTVKVIGFEDIVVREI